LTVRGFISFLAIGSAFATVEEFLTVIVLRHDVPTYLFTLLVLFPSYLTVVYLFGRSLDWLAPHHPARHRIHLLASGGLGLLLDRLLGRRGNPLPLGRSPLPSGHTNLTR
jgi:hypothetical protein